MPGIKVEVKRARRWWYVVADFGDGHPVSKGPMSESDARAMAAELEDAANRMEGVQLRDRSLDEEEANRRAAYAFLSLASAVVLVIVMAAYLALR